MREKLFTLSRSQRDELERRYKQTNERRIAVSRPTYFWLIRAFGDPRHDVIYCISTHLERYSTQWPLILVFCFLTPPRSASTA